MTDCSDSFLREHWDVGSWCPSGSETVSGCQNPSGYTTRCRPQLADPCRALPATCSRFLGPSGPTSCGICGRREALFWTAGEGGRLEEGYRAGLPGRWTTAPGDDTHPGAHFPTVTL